MTRYKLYAGLSGGYGGAVYQTTEEFENEQAATWAAYELACSEYDVYDTFNWNNFIEELKEDQPGLEEDAYEAIASQAEDDDRENWIEYYVIEETDENKDDND